MGTHHFVIEGKEFQVEVGNRSGSSVPVSVNGKPYTVEITGPLSARAVAPVTSVPAPAPLPATAPVVAAAGAGEIRAPIPGVVLNVLVGPGQPVNVGTKLVVIEAMKMENEIVSDVGGVVVSVAVRPQQDVKQGDLLLQIAAG